MVSFFTDSLSVLIRLSKTISDSYSIDSVPFQSNDQSYSIWIAYIGPLYNLSTAGKVFFNNTGNINTNACGANSVATNTWWRVFESGQILESLKVFKCYLNAI